MKERCQVPNLIPAVAYYRMSSDKQEASIADQRTAVEQYARDKGYSILREYVDEGISGWKSEQRKSFQRLIEEAASVGDFEAVLCWDQDRFSRFPVLEANHYWYLLDRAGVHISTVAQGRLNFEDLGEWLKASVVQHGKAEYVRDLARNTTRGLRKRKLQGNWVGGPPYGYQLNEGRLELGDDSEIAVVRRIFDLRSKGYGLNYIAKQLNADGITTPRGAGWATQTIRHILQREAYIGDTVVGKHARGKYERITPEVVTIAQTHPAIIDRATWDAVQRMPKFVRRANGRGGSEGAALSGLVRCGCCQAPMYAITFSATDYYICSSYHGKGTCGHCVVRRGPLLAAVSAKIREVVLMGSKERLEAAIQQELDRRKVKAVDNDAIRRKLATLDRQIERASDRLLVVDDSLVDDLQRSLLLLKDQRSKAAATLDVRPAKSRQVTAKAIAAKVWELDRILATAPATTVRHSLTQLIDHIRLDFREAGISKRGRRFEFVGGLMRLRSEEIQPLGRSSS
jgi:site-specific DNA recombinase